MPTVDMQDTQEVLDALLEWVPEGEEEDWASAEDLMETIVREDLRQVDKELKEMKERVEKLNSKKRDLEDELTRFCVSYTPT